MTGVPLSPCEVRDLALRYGGTVRGTCESTVRRLVPVRQAGAGDLGVLLHARYVEDATLAIRRGAALLVEASLANKIASPVWLHPHASWVLAQLLEAIDITLPEVAIGPDCQIAPSAVLFPGVQIGARVTIGPGAVVGAPGFGFVTSPEGQTRAIRHLGGVVIEDDVHVGALATIAAGTIGPTILRRGAKLDAQVHVGHNCDIGESTFVAAQTGFAGSVVVGKGVLIGGQVGVADHVTIGDGARLAGKSGVIGDVPAGATYAGYPATPRSRWLRGLAHLYRQVARRDPDALAAE